MNPIINFYSYKLTPMQKMYLLRCVVNKKIYKIKNIVSIIIFQMILVTLSSIILWNSVSSRPLPTFLYNISTFGVACYGVLLALFVAMDMMYFLLVASFYREDNKVISDEIALGLHKVYKILFPNYAKSFTSRTSQFFVYVSQIYLLIALICNGAWISVFGIILLILSNKLFNLATLFTMLFMLSGFTDTQISIVISSDEEKK